MKSFIFALATVFTVSANAQISKPGAFRKVSCAAATKAASNKDTVCMGKIVGNPIKNYMSLEDAGGLTRVYQVVHTENQNGTNKMRFKFAGILQDDNTVYLDPNVKQSQFDLSVTYYNQAKLEVKSLYGYTESEKTGGRGFKIDTPALKNVKGISASAADSSTANSTLE